MEGALLAGIFAGYAIAVPVGAIAVLIIEAGMVGGLRRGLAAGAGAATVDLTYCATALGIGGAVGRIFANWVTPLQVASGGILIAIGVRGLLALVVARLSAPRSGGRTAAPRHDGRASGSARALYLRFIALTALNPATVIYFLALAVGLPGLGSDPAQAVAFTIGAASASLSWQLFLGAVGAAAGRLLPERLILATRVGGQILILIFGARIALAALGVVD